MTSKPISEILAYLPPLDPATPRIDLEAASIAFIANARRDAIAYQISRVANELEQRSSK